MSTGRVHLERATTAVEGITAFEESREPSFGGR